MTTTTQHLIVDRIREDGTHTEDGWQHRRYRFDLYAGSFDEAGYVLSNAPYRMGMGLLDWPPTADEIIESILTDIQSIEGCEDWVDWAEELGSLTDAKSVRKARDDYHEINARRSLIEERIGRETLVDLIDGLNS